MSNLEPLCEMLKSSLPEVRHKAALDLMGIGNPAAVPFLIEAIEKPENRNYRGTLIYALSAFSCAGRFSQIFAWAADSGYEASAGALYIIDEQALLPCPAEVPACEAILSKLQAQGGDLELIEELQAILHGTMR